MLNCCYNISDQIVYIPVEMIGLGPYQPRRVFDTMKLLRLSESIKRYGILQPISVRFMGEGRYELAAGERRLKAAKMAGLRLIPSVIVNIRDKDAAALSLLENIQRERLGIFEEADGIERLKTIFGYPPEDICRMLGVTEKYVKDRIKLSKLSQKVREKVNLLSPAEEYGRILSELEGEELQLKAAEQIKKYSFDTKTAARLVKRLKEDENAEISEENLKPKIKKYFKDMRLFTNTIKQAVDEMNKSGLKVIYDENSSDNVREINIKITTNNG